MPAARGLRGSAGLASPGETLLEGGKDSGKKHTDRTRLSPSSRGFRENQRQSKGVKEAWADRFYKQRESGN
jgi:hypothetical protein